MNILVASDTFKNSLSALEIGVIISNIASRLNPAHKVINHPFSDGGEGFIENLIYTLGGYRIAASTLNAFQEPIQGHYGIIDNTVFIESAIGSGFITNHLLDPWMANTYGTGLLIQKGLRNDLNKMVIGVGGTITNDLGTGVARALEYKFLDKKGIEVLPHPKNFLKINQIIPPRGKPFQKWDINIAADVNNPLTGPNGAIHTYSPQKGASIDDISRLEDSFIHMAQIINRDVSNLSPNTPGTGAGGGLGFGLATFLDAQIQSGAELFSSLTDFKNKAHHADLIITGEGRIDSQTKNDKVVQYIQNYCLNHNKRLLLICGQNHNHTGNNRTPILSLSEQALPTENPLTDAKKLLSRAVHDFLKNYQLN